MIPRIVSRCMVGFFPGVSLLACGLNAATIITPPASVPTTFTAFGPVASSPAAYSPGLAATVDQISPDLNSGGPGNLEGGPGTAGYPNLQGMANLQTLAINGTITSGSDGIPGSTVGGTLTYTSTFYASFTDQSINTNQYVALGGSYNTPSIQGFLGSISGSQPLPSPGNPWTDFILDQEGFVYVPRAGASYSMALASNDQNDDGTEVLIGGNGTPGSGTVVSFEDADDLEPINGVATLAGGSTTGAFVDTVTFSQAGVYPFELFYAQTWGGAGLNFSFLPTSGSQADDLTFYVPEPTLLPPLALGLAILLCRIRPKAARGANA